MSTTIKVRRGAASLWTSNNTVLADGELGYESDTGKFKIGDGTTHWNVLEYILPQSDVSTLIQTAVSNAISAHVSSQQGIYATEIELTGVVQSLSNYATMSAVGSAITNALAGLPGADLTAYATKAGLSTAISDQATADAVIYPTKTSVNSDLAARALQADFAAHAGQAYHTAGFVGIEYAGSVSVARPSAAGMVVWSKFPTKPTNMTTSDIWLQPDAGSQVPVYLAEMTFEGYAADAVLGTVSNGSGTPFDVVSIGTGGGTANARASIVGGGTRAGEFHVGATAGTTYAMYRGAVGMKTKITVGALWITPGTLPVANLQLVRTRKDSTGGGSYVTAPAIRYNSTNNKFEWLGSDGAVKWTSVQSALTSVPYYILEMEIDCDNQHMRGWVTPSTTGVSELVGDTTTVVAVGTQLDEYGIGSLSNVANSTQQFAWFRVADINVRLNAA